MRGLAGIGAVCAGVMVWAAWVGDRFISLTAAALFAGAMVVGCAIRGVVALRREASTGSGLRADASRANAVQMAGTFLWGGVVMLGVYTLSGLWWWHSWQYGLLMFAIAFVLFLYARAISSPGHFLRGRALLDAGAVLALLQGLGAAGGLYFLISFDKLASIKPDWPANHVFLALGIAICALSLIAGVTHFALRSRGA